jgi:hypothetical protein
MDYLGRKYGALYGLPLMQSPAAPAIVIPA